jgi:hypothetical protein
MTGADIVHRATDQPDPDTRSMHRLLWVFVGLLVLGVAMVSVSFLVYRADARERDAAQDRALVAVAGDARQLYEQVEDLGGDPVVDAPPPDAVVGATGAAGQDGRPGRDGRDGAPGAPGEPGSDGEPGTDGVNGEPGTDGEPGSDGQDGVTPPCLAEETQCRGPAGPAGERGAQGEPGPTCPAGSTLQTRTVEGSPLTPEDDEIWYVCVSDSPEGDPDD